MLCQLLSSFERFALGVKLLVCDFGLTEGQGAFLTAKGILLKRPEELEAGWHPYLYKGSLFEYVKHLDFDVLTWIDSDCVLSSLFIEEVDKVTAKYDQGQPFLAITADLDNNSLGSFIAKNPDKTEPFAKVITEYKLPWENPYLNCGLFSIRCRKTLEEWARLTMLLPPHFLFEQNTFNAVVYKNITKITMWDWATFNVCGSKLNNLQVVGNGHYPGSIRLGDKIIIVTHIAATTAQAAISFEPLILPVADGFLCGLYRFPLNQPLQDFLLGLVAEYTTHNPKNSYLLQQSGALLPENPLVVSGEEFINDPQFAHLFTYGNKAHPKISGQLSG